MYPGLDNAVLLASHFCPLKCGATILGKEYQRHLEDECPRRQALCPEGCGDRIIGSAVDAHRAACPMAALLGRAEAAIRENSVVEFRLAIEGLDEELARARTRLRIRGDEGIGPKHWPSSRCEVRMARIESDGHQLIQRARRRAVDHLTLAIASAGAEPQATGAAVDGPVSAMKFWDGFNAEGGRGARPWDLDPPAMEPLIDALGEAASAGADAELRRRGEAMLLTLLGRMLDAALRVTDEQHTVLGAVVHRVAVSLTYVELEDPGPLLAALESARATSIRANLQAIPTTGPEFYKAVAAGDTEVVKWLLCREQANPSLTDPRSGMPPLITAAKAGNLAMCSLLLEWHAEVDVRCRMDGCSALHWAAAHRSFPTMSLMLNARANPRMQDKRGLDALMKLVRRDFNGPAPGGEWSWDIQEGRRLPGKRLPSSGDMDPEGARAICEADPECVGFTFRAADAESGQASFRILIRGRGQQKIPKPKDEKARLALSEEDRKILEEETEDEQGWVSYLKVPTDPVHDIRLLFSAGADACATDSSGFTALHHHLRSSPSRGDAKVVAALLRGGADVNARDRAKHSTTPLLMAVTAKRADLVRLMLLSAFPPADVDARAADGTSALALAEALGAREVADLLRTAGASAWLDAGECRLGARTTFSFDTRAPAPIG